MATLQLTMKDQFKTFALKTIICQEDQRIHLTGRGMRQGATHKKSFPPVEKIAIMSFQILPIYFLIIHVLRISLRLQDLCVGVLLALTFSLPVISVTENIQVKTNSVPFEVWQMEKEPVCKLLGTTANSVQKLRLSAWKLTAF